MLQVQHEQKQKQKHNKTKEKKKRYIVAIAQSYSKPYLPIQLKKKKQIEKRQIGGGLQKKSMSFPQVIASTNAQQKYSTF